ncbi:transglutaminase-like domain-containing protein [Cohnella nanjingensis]|uniref:Transglutaminase domain-containing protein n=1 Tax=Cohnella nanjingensis TaxID=1387779 RepID=A0A7X0RMZ9_9BACL|nr:transglutaminase-like domain-containing protein [Cohnella nanjingensis]MBB6670518.1 transglutaminase domain-containing protein [Cohnella nanjingensis]
MFKKPAILLFAAAISLAFATERTEAASTTIDQGLLDKGVIKVDYTPSNQAKAIVRISKDNATFDYALSQGAQYPLQLGNGSYTVLIAEAVSGSKYKVVSQDQIDLQMADETEVFKQSNPIIQWDETTKAVVKAKQLTKSAKTDKEKVKAVYGFVTKTFTYDEAKAKTVAPGYIPNLDKVYKASKGICYDFASTFAAMTRSVGIPTKLVIGKEKNHPDILHAWNEVYLQDQWVVVDTTYDAARVQAGQTPAIFKDAANYKGTKVY